MEFKRLLAVTGSALTLGLASFSASALVPTATGNYCLDQGLYFLQNSFGPEAALYDIRIADSAEYDASPYDGYTIWASSNLCDGKFVFRYRLADDQTCSVGHYGSVPDYLSSVHARGGCQALIPGQVFPTLDEVQPPTFASQKTKGAVQVDKGYDKGAVQVDKGAQVDKGYDKGAVQVDKGKGYDKGVAPIQEPDLDQEPDLEQGHVKDDTGSNYDY